MTLLQGHASERVVQKATACTAVLGGVLHRGILHHRDGSQSCYTLVNVTSQRLLYAL